MARKRKQDEKEEPTPAADPLASSDGLNSADGELDEDGADLIPQGTVVCALTGEFKPESSRFSFRTPSSRETPRISSLEGVGGKIGCPGLTLHAPG